MLYLEPGFAASLLRDADTGIGGASLEFRAPVLEEAGQGAVFARAYAATITALWGVRLAAEHHLLELMTQTLRRRRVDAKRDAASTAVAQLKMETILWPTGRAPSWRMLAV